MITVTEIKKKALQHWTSQRFLKAFLKDEPYFPLDIPFRKVTASQVLEDFTGVRRWLNELRENSKACRGHGYCLEYQSVNYRQLGQQALPSRIYFESAPDWLRFIGKQQSFQRFQRLLELTLTAQPALRPWLEQKPERLLEYQDAWPRLLAVGAFLQYQPHPGCYIRELDIPGVDSKFIEQHKAILTELLDRILPADGVNLSVAGLAAHGFERRYGFKYDQPLIRLRILDEELTDRYGLTDLSVPLDQFKRLRLPCERVFITENKINGLSFPALKRAIVIFGLGYGVRSLGQTPWLRDKTLFYWGDIDTHGFAILSQLRGYFPQTRSLLMDRQTLLAFQGLWGSEADDKRCLAELCHLTEAEQALYQDLRTNALGDNIRLEQERIGFGYLCKALKTTVEAH